MEQIGVEAVVEGLLKFGSDMESMQKNIDNVANSSTILGGIFDGVGNALSGFADSIIRTAEIALGNLLADAIEGAIQLLGDLIQKTLDAGTEFQNLEIRLRNINFAALTDSGVAYDDAMRQAVELTKEQVAWAVKLANTTPFDTTDVAQIYAMARSYSLTDEEARKITETTLNFTSAMGLSNIEAERIVKNFGQMQQQGRITQRDLNDLARGAFVPVNSLLDSIRQRFEETGATSVDFSDDIAKLNEKMASYTDQLAVAEQRQREYGLQSQKAAADNAEALQKMRDKLQGYQDDLTVAEQRQSEFTDKTAESTKMANQFRIDDLKKNIEDTKVEIDKLTSGVETMGSTVKDSTRLANQQKIDELKKNIAETTAQLAGFQSIMEGGGTITKEAFAKMLKEGIPAKEFIDSFTSMVEKRFPHAAEEMARTFQGATENIQQTVTALFGLNLVTPILGLLGEKLASILDVIISPEKYTQLETAVTKVKDAVVNILGEILGLIPSAETLTDGVISSLGSLADWLNQNQEMLIQWVRDIATWISDVLVPAIRDQLVPFIRDQLIPAIKEFVGWIWDHREEIMKFFVDMAITIRDQIVPIVRDVLVPAVKELMTWLYEHRDKILPFLENAGKAFLAFAIVQQVVVWVAGLISALLTVVTTIVSVAAVVSYFGASLVSIVGSVGSVIAVVAALVIEFEFLRIAFTEIFTFIAIRVTQLVLNIIQTFDELRNALEEGDWVALGMAIINGIVRGIKYATVDLVTALWEAAMAGIQEFKNALGISSPSDVFYEFGYNITEGVINGIRDNTGEMMNALTSAAEQMWNSWLDFWGIHSPSKLSSDSADNIMTSFSDEILNKTRDAVSAMQKAAVSIAAPMINLPAVTQSFASTAPAMAGATSNTSNYYNLSINSSANTEPIVQDFNMLQSLAGG